MANTSRIALALIASTGLTIASAPLWAQSSGMGHGPMGTMSHGMGMGMGMGMGTGTGTGMGMRQAPGVGGHRPMAGPTAMLTRHDDRSAADMGVVHELLVSNTAIRRTVTKLPDGIRTVTESDEPQVAKSIQGHVASMSERLQDGREFNIFSTTLPVLFENHDRIVSKIDMTEKGSVVTRTSTDPKVVAALQAHADEVTELVEDGMAGMRRGMMTRMAGGQGGASNGMRGMGGRGHTDPGHRH